jgi:amino acid adenylation domain-containing protein
MHPCLFTNDPFTLLSRQGNRVGRAPLSRLQECLWLLDDVAPGPSAYHISSATRLRGALDVAALERALSELVARHEALRTTFEDKGGSVTQIIHPPAPVRLERRDLARVPAADRERIAAEQIRREASVSFDLRRGPVFRAKLLVLGPTEHVLLLTTHRIVSDGRSEGILARELGRLYDAFRTAAQSPLAPVELQYGDYAAWEREQASDLDPQIAFWKDSLAGAPVALALPTDRPRPAKQRLRGALVTRDLDAAVRDRLHARAREHGATPYMVLLSALGALLARLSGQSEVVVAAPILNRNGPELERTIGPFTNTLPVRVDVGDNPTFAALLTRVRDTTLAAFTNGHVPFERIVQELDPPRDTGRNPIAQVCLDVLGRPEFRVHLADLDAMPVRDTAVGSRFDLTFYVEENEGLQLDLVYDRDLFDEHRMQRLLARFEALLAALVDRPLTRVADLDLATLEERAVRPDPTAPLPAGDHGSVLARFHELALAQPDAPAVSDGARRWTYGELDARANRLSSWLVANGHGEGRVVAIVAERTALTVWAMLGVLGAGAAFVILDAHHPPPRIAEQLRAAAPSVVLTTVAFDTSLPRLDLSDAEGPWSSAATTPPNVAIDGKTRAYVAFTSGTTGGPKALAGAHGPLAHFFEWHRVTHALGPSDRFSALSGLGHDPFLRDVLGALWSGASVALPPDVLLEADRLAAWLAEEGVTVVHLTPSLGEVLSVARGRRLPKVRLFAFGGEVLRAELCRNIKRLAPSAAVVNFYGATETPQAIAYHPIPDDADTPTLPVGRGIDGVQLLVLSASGTLAAVDEEGDVVVRTPHLALGYLDGDHRGFGVNPFTRTPGDAVYRTGDRGRYLPDGSVLVTGRADDQIKVRGFRVELGEIEAALRAQPGVQRAAIVFDPARNAVHAYVVGSVDGLHAALRAQLPDYLVPQTFTSLPTIPLTRNGKLDKAALPAPVRSAADDAAPAGAVEETIAAIWREVLDLDALGRHEHFFDVGGHSLVATAIAARLSGSFGVEVSVRAVFDAPTVAELGESIGALLAGRNGLPRPRT